MLGRAQNSRREGQIVSIVTCVYPFSTATWRRETLLIRRVSLRRAGHGRSGPRVSQEGLARADRGATEVRAVGEGRSRTIETQGHRREDADARWEGKGTRQRLLGARATAARATATAATGAGHPVDCQGGKREAVPEVPHGLPSRDLAGVDLGGQVLDVTDDGQLGFPVTATQLTDERQGRGGVWDPGGHFQEGGVKGLGRWPICSTRCQTPG